MAETNEDDFDDTLSDDDENDILFQELTKSFTSLYVDAPLKSESKHSDIKNEQDKPIMPVKTRKYEPPINYIIESDSDTDSVVSDESDASPSEPWNHILESLNYKNEDNFIVTAENIKKCGKSWKGAANQFEPRLLAYQTSSQSRPSIFKKFGLCILPIKNGTYMLCKENLYCDLDYSGKEIVPIDRDKSSVILSIGGSETSLIDNLRYSGVFERPEILGEKITHGPMLNGRHRCNLEMLLGKKNISISGVQYETDSCFESAHKVLIIEGKSSSKEIDSFNIRQLYFPFRECYKYAKDKKDIVCIFVHELKKITHIWKYTFKEPNRMDSIELCGHYMYKFSS
jgi:hypothetical protein